MRKRNGRRITRRAHSFPSKPVSQDILLDPLFETAAKLMVNLGGGKSSDLQKRFAIGDYKSQLLLSAIEELGILSPAESDGTRRA